MTAERAPRVKVGRYVLFDPIASGGMATVYFGRLAGVGGFKRTVAIKRLHPHLATDADFVAMLLDEARLASRIRHPNVVPTFDVVAEGTEVFVVMEYVHGESVSKLMRAASRDEVLPPLQVTASILCGALHGLHAAHEAKDDEAKPLGIIHRDVSPQNILVGVDGVARLVDFGVAKAAGRLHTTQDRSVKGKLGYMSPEQLRGEKLDRRTDVYAAGVVLWEMLTGERLFARNTDGETVAQVLEQNVVAPSTRVPGLPAAVDEIVLRAVAREPEQRFDTARQMAIALETATGVASAVTVGEWVQLSVGDGLGPRENVLARIESAREDAEPGLDTPATYTGLQKGTSQISSISVSSGSRSRPRFGVLAGIGLGVMIAGGSAIAVWRFGPASTPSAAPIASPASSTIVVAATASPPATTPIEIETPTEKPVAQPSATARRVVRTAKPNCDPPFSVDSAGIRHYKPECPLQ